MKNLYNYLRESTFFYTFQSFWLQPGSTCIYTHQYISTLVTEEDRQWPLRTLCTQTNLYLNLETSQHSECCKEYSLYIESTHFMHKRTHLRSKVWRLLVYVICKNNISDIHGSEFWADYCLVQAKLWMLISVKKIKRIN